ncbi:MAG: anti-sigma factor family protein [Gemmatimonadota bacterium]
MKHAIEENELHAYVDGQMPASERERFEALLRDDAAARDSARAYLAQNEALHAAFDGVLAEPHALHLPESTAHGWTRGPLAIAATLLLGIGIGFISRGLLTAQSAPLAAFAHQAVLAYVAYVPEVRHPVEVPAQEEQHLVAWLSKRLSVPLRAPQLDAAGYRLLGGRLLPAASSAGDAPVALLMYENPKGKRLSLLVRREADNKDTAFRFTEEGSTRVFYWIDGPCGYALAGDVDREELLRLSRLVYQQLNP